jgi:predicted nucleic acid-binding protein
VRRNNHTDQGVLIDPDELAAELAEAATVLAAVGLVVLDRDVLDRAGALEAPTIRTLDAIHLVSALDLQSAATEFVTYDKRLIARARAAGLAVLSPS